MPIVISVSFKNYINKAPRQISQSLNDNVCLNVGTDIQATPTVSRNPCNMLVSNSLLTRASELQDTLNAWLAAKYWINCITLKGIHKKTDNELLDARVFVLVSRLANAHFVICYLKTQNHIYGYAFERLTFFGSILTD